MASYDIERNNTDLPLRFLLVLASDHITGATGKTPTVTLAKNDGLGFVAATGTVTEVGNGEYDLSPSPADANVLGPLTLHATASGCDPSDTEFLVVNYNPLYAVPTITPNTEVVTVRTFLTRVLRRLKAYGPGEDPTADDLADTFSVFKQLLDSFGAEPLMKYGQTRTEFALNTTNGTPDDPYLVGPGGDIDIPRPQVDDLQRLTYINPAMQTTTPLELTIFRLTEQAWNSTAQKTLTNTIPTFAFYDPSFPYGKLYLWMMPTTSDLTGVIYTRTQIAVLGSLNDSILWPAGYAKAIRDLLVVELWPEFREGDPSSTLLRAATDARSNLVAMNHRMVDMSTPAGGWYDIYSDTILPR